MSRFIPILLALGVASIAGCDDGYSANQGRPAESVDVGKADGRSTAPDDVCVDDDLYGDGLCDPGCLHPDPDCMDCGSQARRLVGQVEQLAGRPVGRLTAEELSTPDPEGKQLLRVAGGGTSYVVSVELDREQGGDRSEYCIVHGLQDERRMLELLDHTEASPDPAPPTDTCAEAAADAVQVLEFHHARGVLGPDGTRLVVDDDDGRELPTTQSSIETVTLATKVGDQELVRVHVDRTAPWAPGLESYLVHTRTTKVTDPETDEVSLTCEVQGLQNRTAQVDMRE